MSIDEIETLIKEFRWNTLQRMYGCAHSSIIGFISTEWINFSQENSILDGAPSPIIGKGRKGQKIADILLCRGEKPFIPIEVETQVSKYNEKMNTLVAYIDNEDFIGIEFGLLFMTNLCKGDMKYKHNWNDIKKNVREKKKNIVLVSIIKERAELNSSILNDIRKRNQYFSWDIVIIDYWIYQNGSEKEGNLWKR